MTEHARHNAMDDPGEIAAFYDRCSDPMRELLGDMLREQGQPALALKEYEVSMKNAPNRLRGFYGAAKAAEAAGKSKRAAGYFNQLARLARTADGDRAELREMKQYLALK